MIIRLWALCQDERHMVTMHVFTVKGIRCHTQCLARSVTLDTTVSLPRTSSVLQNTKDMCSMQSMKTVMPQRGSPAMSCKWNYRRSGILHQEIIQIMVAGKGSMAGQKSDYCLPVGPLCGTSSIGKIWICGIILMWCTSRKIYVTTLSAHFLILKARRKIP